MKCPFCGFGELKVTDSRNALDVNAIRRRRECLNCNCRFTTFETVELILQVKKRDGLYEDFQEQKLISGLDSACRHTCVSHAQVRTLASTIVAELMQQQLREITSREIGEIAMKYLKTMDTIAYIRFACVYRRFKDIGELMEAIHSVTPEEVGGE
ncbi:MAG: Transcriptional repressor NrdR [Chlamydiales bacterium]|nr:Transcriptional repressor NrdR [Chlamydiales bacterium]MCH9619251.1 Transcriptional repressor NrdR [Chlamydiales bacterium]MCH9622513.1 Transcriptional repressor NrdR [Chlamydiales bacterium]